MQRFYSPSTGCSYLAAIHGDYRPLDAIAISEDVYQNVIANPAVGKVRAHDESGQPILIDPAGPTDAELTHLERRWRDAELESVIWLRNRHRDQVEIEYPTTLSQEQFLALLVYLQALRDWPQSSDFPDDSKRPLAPAFINEFRGEQ